MDIKSMTQQPEGAKILQITDSANPSLELSQFLHDLGYSCLTVYNSQQAYIFLESNQIDLLIISTPELLGDQIERLRELMSTYLPIIVVSETVDDILLDAYQDFGIASYLSLPLNVRLLQTNIRSALRVRQLYQHEINQHRQLLNFWQQVDMEQELAAKIYNNVLQRNYLQTEAVKSVMSPMALFNGDLLLVEKTPDQHLYLLLGDFTGHGLTASVGATPVADIFYGMARKGFALTEIMHEINLKLYKMLPTNMFLAATAVALYPDSRILSLICCGLPEHYLVNDWDSRFETIPSKNIPLGIVEAINFEVQSFSVDGHQRLYMFTDGVLEAQSIEGELFGADRVLQAINQSPCSGMTKLQADLAAHTKGLNQQDDLSFVELACVVENVPWQIDEKHTPQRQLQALSWKNSMEFQIDALREINPLPVMLNALMEIQGMHQHRQAIFLIASELFANALDHGVLKMDSALKATAEGFMEFYRLKQERLDNWQSGWIRLLFHHQATEQGGRLTIKVTDSGEGFNWKMLHQHLESNQGFCGRGVKLVETLCTRLTYHGKGNRVTAVFDWVN